MELVTYTRFMIMYVHARADHARRNGRNEVGASALEWAIISALVAAVALLVARTIVTRVRESNDEIEGL